MSIWKRLLGRNSATLLRPARSSKTAAAGLTPVEAMEPRILLAADTLHVGVVYIEQDVGSDDHGDTFEITFDGGAKGTQLQRVVIEGDQESPGFGLTDVFFDTATTGLGTDGAHPFTVRSREGIDAVSWTVMDGGTRLEIEFDGFEAGERFVFEVDVDEVQEYDPDITDLDYTNEGFDPITSGIEFQGSKLTAVFSAPHFFDVDSSSEFRNRYDNALVESGLDLPTDDADGKRDRTAGAIDALVQEPLPVSVAGTVYEDIDADLVRHTGDAGIADVALSLWIKDGDQYVDTGLRADTNDRGDYAFGEDLDLKPGTYQVRETQPDGYLSVGAVPGTVDGVPVGEVQSADVLSELTISLGGLAAVDYDFAEYVSASLGGRVHLSTKDGDCFGSNVLHVPVSDAVVQLLDANGKVTDATTTDTNGDYGFVGLPPGSYSIRELTPDHLIDGGAKAGGAGGKVIGGGDIADIRVGSGDAATDYNFCERVPARLSGNVYHDRNDNGLVDTGEEGIGAVSIQLIDANGAIVAETTTSPNGKYAFERVIAGVYSVVEIHPADWIDGRDAPGTINGVTLGAANNPGDRIDGVELRWGDDGANFNFGELKPANISGRVQLSTPDGDCFGKEVSHIGVAGATVRLLNANGDLAAETTTDADGNYEFADITPGEYSVVELTPPNLLDGGAQAGQVDGESRGEVDAEGVVRGISALSADNIKDVLFCEHKPATISGTVFQDDDNDGRRGGEEDGIAGVQVILYDLVGNAVASTATDDNGFYEFSGITAGRYSLREIQPDDFLDGMDRAGTVGGRDTGVADNPGDQIRDIDLGWGEDGINFDFAEILPAVLAGMVHTDVSIRNCVFEPDRGDTALAGVRIDLLDAQGQILNTTTTDALGAYQFHDVIPGVYSIHQQQPAGYFDGSQSAPDGKGDVSTTNEINAITVRGGAHIVDLNFCEDPPGTLSGYVFQDGDAILLTAGQDLPTDIFKLRDGQRTADDTPLPGILVKLRDGVDGAAVNGESDRVLPGIYPDGRIEASTNDLGFFEFTGLKAGSYAVFQEQPEGYLDGLDTPGTTSGFVFNAGAEVDLEVALALTVSPNNDAIVRISLPPGAISLENNFSELLTEVSITPIVPPIVPPTDPPKDPPTIIDNALPRDIYNPPIHRRREYGNVAAPGQPLFTWHLSVIDAGQPRGDGYLTSLDEPIWFASSEMPVANRNLLSQGQWSLRKWLTQTSTMKTFNFGLAGGIPVAGDFNGDGLYEIGVFYQGEWFIDINGNGTWDAADLWAKLGHDGDLPVVGDWDGDGKHDIGIFGPSWPADPRALAAEPGLPDDENPPTGQPKNMPPEDTQASGHRVMKLSAKGRMRADAVDHVFLYGGLGDIPVVGDWNGDGVASIGIFRDGIWKLDIDGDGHWSDNDHTARFGTAGAKPIVGDFNGDGVDEIGFYKNGVFYLDANGNMQLDAHDRVFEMGELGDQPVGGDWDGDGVDDVGTFHDSDRVARQAG